MRKSVKNRKKAGLWSRKRKANHTATSNDYNQLVERVEKSDRREAEDEISNFLRDRQINKEIVELNKRLGR